MSSEGELTERAPLKADDYSQGVNVAPSAPELDDPNPNQINNAGKYVTPQSNIDVNNALPQQIIIQPSNPANYNQNNNGHVIIQPMNPEYEEQQPLSPNRAHDQHQGIRYRGQDQNQNQGIPQDNLITPSQDQIAAVLPQFDEGQVQSNDDEDRDGIGCIEGCKESPHIITWLLSITFWSMIALGIIGVIVSWWYWYIFLIVAGVVYICLLIETGCSAMHKYLSNILEKEGATEFIERLKREPIEIWWHVACYHYETRTRVVHTTDSNGRSRTRYETYQEKVWYMTYIGKVHLMSNEHIL